MNETSTDPGNPQAPPPFGQQPPPPPHQDLERLRRSVSDRYIAGVAGGLGRHFGIDPTIIRVLLAVLAFFGGAGVLLYGVCWLFVPEEGQDRAPIQVNGEPRRLLLLAAAAIAFLLAMGDAFSGFNAGWRIASLGVVVALVLIVRDKRGDRSAAHEAQAQAWAAHRQAQAAGTPVIDPVAASASVPSESAATYGGAATATYDPDHAPAPTPAHAPAWQPPRPPLVAPRPKRTGVIWFWPTLALIAIALGVLGVIDSGSTDIDAWAYPATAVAITGLMLVVGSITGRPGGLILIGVVSTMALSMATVLGGFHFDGREIKEAPTAAAAVQSSYTAHNGRIRLDLTEVADPQNLAGRTIEISLGAGQIEVIVPKSMNLHIDAEFDFAGGINIPGYDGGGIQDSVERTVVGTPVTTTPALDLELDANVGQITVEQR